MTNNLSGRITRISYYNDGTTQVELDRCSNDAVSLSFPFYKNIDRKHLGKTVAFSEYAESNCVCPEFDNQKLQRQIIKGEDDFEITVTSTFQQRKELREKGRTLATEVSLN